MRDSDNDFTKQQQRDAEFAEADVWFLRSLGDLTEETLPTVDWRALIDIARRRLRHELGAWAQRVLNEFYITHWKYRQGDGVEKQYAHYQVRVTNRDWTIYIQWYRVINTRNGQMRAEFLSVPRTGFRMRNNQFPLAKAWEKSAIMQAEDELMKIRKCAARLEAMRLDISALKQVLTAANLASVEDKQNVVFD